jgi:hypothetical protein
VHFPGDAAPVLLQGIAGIESSDLAANAAGGDRVVHKTLMLGNKSTPNLKSRTLEKLAPFSSQAQMGYSVTFYFEKETAGTEE